MRPIGDALNKPGRRPRLAVVVPVYNEERALPSVIVGLQRLREAHPDWEVLPFFIDDGSTDQSSLLLLAAAQQLPLRMIRHPLNLGIGGAVRTGLLEALRWGADVAVQLDGDGQHPAEELPKIVAPVLRGETDVAVGSRYVDGAGGRVSSRMRWAGTRGFALLLKLLVGSRVKDVTSGFRAFGAEALEFLSRCYPDDYPEVQAYVPLYRAGFRVQEVPVSMKRRDTGRSSITPIHAAYYLWKVALATMLDRVRPVPKRRPRKGAP